MKCECTLFKKKVQKNKYFLNIKEQFRGFDVPWKQSNCMYTEVKGPIVLYSKSKTWQYSKVLPSSTNSIFHSEFQGLLYLYGSTMTLHAVLNVLNGDRKFKLYKPEFHIIMTYKRDFILKQLQWNLWTAF